MRDNIETPMLVRDVAAQLTEIARQKPTATISIYNEFNYGFLLDEVMYDPENNTAVFLLVENY